MRTRTDPPGPRDVLGLQHAEAVLLVVPRFGLYVQLERTAAPTPWTPRFANASADAVTAPLRSAPRAIGATRIARSRVAPRRATPRSRPRANVTAAVPKGASIIVITSGRTAPA